MDKFDTIINDRSRGGALVANAPPFWKKISYTVQIVKYRRTRNIHILHYAIDYNPLNAISEVRY